MMNEYAYERLMDDIDRMVETFHSSEDCHKLAEDLREILKRIVEEIDELGGEEDEY